jgi:tetratricopeptide (TPR) repeat protein
MNKAEQGGNGEASEPTRADAVPLETATEATSAADDDLATVPTSASRRGSAAHKPATPPPMVRVDGLAETLHDVRHELQLLSHATKFNWINHRLILLRNALIAFSILVVVVIIAIACYREAYRQTLTIAAFDVPEKLAERGITGQVVAKILFDELVKRRDLVTTLEKGELKGAWAENRSDVAIPEAKFTLQSVFRYLRYMTGNEIAVDGEFIVDANGEDVTMRVRVAGRQPTIVKGKLANWEALTGELALGVLDVTQPAVVAAYLGIKAETPEDLVALSKRLRRMSNQDPKLSGEVMSVAYDAYGSALRRQEKLDKAALAFNEAMALDPTNGVAVINAASAQANQRKYDESAALFKRAQTMQLPESVKRGALRSRLSSAVNTGDCDAARAVLNDARQSQLYDPLRFADTEALIFADCDFEESRAVALLAKYVAMHPDNERYAATLARIQYWRPEKRYVEESVQIGRDAIAAGVVSGGLFGNHAFTLVELGRIEEAREILARMPPSAALALIGTTNRRQPGLDLFELAVLRQQKEYAKADEIMRRLFAETPFREHYFSLWAGQIKLAMNQYEEAIAAYNDGLKRSPKNCLLWQELGTVYATKGDVPTALATWDKGIAAVPKCGLNYNEAARLLIKQNRVPEAKQKLDTLIKIAPNSDGAVIAKEILATLGPKS